MFCDDFLRNVLEAFQNPLDFVFVRRYIINQLSKPLRHGMLGVLVGIKRGASGASGIRKR